MKQTITILSLILTLPLLSYNHKAYKDFDLENEKFLNFLAAIQNESTFNYFTVIKVKNLNTGEIKEICTMGNFVSGALHIELKAGYDKKGQETVLNFAKGKKDRYFEFKNKKALNNLSFSDYNTSLVEKIQMEYNIDKAIENFKKDKEFSISLSDDKMKAYAHVLFNRGYLSGEYSCWGGGELKFVKPK